MNGRLSEPGPSRNFDPSLFSDLPHAYYTLRWPLVNLAWRCLAPADIDLRPPRLAADRARAWLAPASA